MERRKVRIGSRDSRLAVLQTQLFMAEIHRAHPELKLELITMKTTGDLILDKTLDQIGGKGLFVKELDQALLDGRIDLSVHSLKDMPMEVPRELPLLAFSAREDPRDALILPQDRSALGEGPIGSASARRTVQLGTLFPGREVRPVRGNVLTRLAKLDSGEYAALVLACAGLKRLGLSERISRAFTTQEMLPAAGQGILVAQGRVGEDYSFLAPMDDPVSRVESTAERAFVQALEGGCSSPIAAFAQIEGNELVLRGLYCTPDMPKPVFGSVAGEPEEARRLGEELARRLRGPCSM